MFVSGTVAVCRCGWWVHSYSHQTQKHDSEHNSNMEDKNTKARTGHCTHTPHSLSKTEKTTHTHARTRVPLTSVVGMSVWYSCQWWVCLCAGYSHLWWVCPSGTHVSGGYVGAHGTHMCGGYVSVRVNLMCVGYVSVWFMECVWV